MLYALILAGGVGSRLWPKSRNSLPKQFLNLTGEETLIQTSVNRILPIVPKERIFVATGERYVSLVQAQLPELPASNVIGEISGKNTAPAIGLGALHIANVGPDDTMVVLTADHIIPDEAAFRQSIQAAAKVAEQGKLVTLGITPTGPETGYGYVHRGKQLGTYQELPAFEVSAFLEKPALPTAREFFESGEHYWNSGMFIWQVSTFFSAIETHMPNLYTQLMALKDVMFNPDSGETVAKIWAEIESESIDFGLMEKTSNVAMVPMDAGWNDVGNWAALYEELAQQPGENIAVNAQHLDAESSGVLIQGTGKTVATIGLSNIAIIQTDDAILVCAMDKTQDVKKIVEKLKQDQNHMLL